jgi:hypothetical protein
MKFAILPGSTLAIENFPSPMACEQALCREEFHAETVEVIVESALCVVTHWGEAIGRSARALCGVCDGAQLAR